MMTQNSRYITTAVLAVALVATPCSSYPFSFASMRASCSQITAPMAANLALVALFSWTATGYTLKIGKTREAAKKALSDGKNSRHIVLNNRIKNYERKRNVAFVLLCLSLLSYTYLTSAKNLC